MKFIAKLNAIPVTTIFVMPFFVPILMPLEDMTPKVVIILVDFWLLLFSVWALGVGVYLWTQMKPIKRPSLTRLRVNLTIILSFVVSLIFVVIFPEPPSWLGFLLVFTSLACLYAMLSVLYFLSKCAVGIEKELESQTDIMLFFLQTIVIPLGVFKIQRIVFRLEHERNNPS